MISARHELISAFYPSLVQRGTPIHISNIDRMLVSDTCVYLSGVYRAANGEMSLLFRRQSRIQSGRT